MFRMILLLAHLAAPFCAAQTSKLTYTYDDAGRLTKVDYSNGQSIVYSYDKAGNLVASTSSQAPASNKRKAETKGKTSSQTSKTKE